MKIWQRIMGHKIEKLYSDPRYPNNPDNTTILTSFDTGRHLGDNYGCTLSAFYKVCKYLDLPYV